MLQGVIRRVGLNRLPRPARKVVQKARFGVQARIRDAAEIALIVIGVDPLKKQDHPYYMVVFHNKEKSNPNHISFRLLDVLDFASCPCFAFRKTLLIIGRCEILMRRFLCWKRERRSSHIPYTCPILHKL